MDLSGYLRVLRKRWMIITWVTLVGLAAGAALTIRQTPMYQATAQSFVTIASNGGDSTGAITQASQFSFQRVKSYTQLVSSATVLQPVIDQLKLDTSVATLRGRVTAKSPLDTVLINVTAQDPDPGTAAKIANAVAARLGTVVESLETPKNGTSPVGVTLTQQAAAPSYPVSPNARLNLILGMLGGLALGVALATLREQTDTTIKSPQALQDLTKSTPLGLVAYDSEMARQPLVALSRRSAKSEAFRTIRTNLQFVDVDAPPRSVVVTSPLPGDGKSTTACNLAITFAQARKAVCLVEADLRRPQVAKYLGIEGGVGLTNVLAGQHKLSDVLIPWNRGMLSVLTAGTLPPGPNELLGSKNMVALLDDLRQRFEIVIIDSPPLVNVTDAAIIARVTDGALLVARYGRTNREQLKYSVEALQAVNARLLGTVLTFLPSRRGDQGYGYGYGYGQEESVETGRLHRDPWFGSHADRAASRDAAADGGADTSPEQPAADGERASGGRTDGERASGGRTAGDRATTARPTDAETADADPTDRDRTEDDRPDGADRADRAGRARSADWSARNGAEPDVAARPKRLQSEDTVIIDLGRTRQ